MNYQELIHSPLISSQIISLIEKASHNSVPVLIQGEHGTGKELVAKIIHHAGDWKYYRFYRIDCKTQTEESFNYQLQRIYTENNFGTIPSTVYLKEVSSLEPPFQSKLLELMEDGLFQVGVEKKIMTHLRFIASSSEDLREKMAQGRFSEDLQHRLNILSIHIPPLRDRAKEISTIVKYVLEDYSKKMRINRVGISDVVLKLLQNYWWPGNMRELQQVMVRSAMFSEGNILTEKDLLFDSENENKSFVGFLKKADRIPPESRPANLCSDQNTHLFSLFLMELVHRVKNPLVSIKTFTQLLREKFNDEEFREHFYKIVTEDIEKIDTVMNGLVRYVKINTPIEKKDTIHFILEDILKKHETELEHKKIKLFKQFEKDLPETTLHDEQLRYILSALLQYAIPFISPNGSIGFLTKSSDGETETAGGKTSRQTNGRYIEILIVFTGYRKPFEQLETVLGIPAFEKEEAVELELRLIQEIIQKNRGMMKFEVNEKKPRTVISLKFPTERRKLIYYQSANV
ncbi:MAG TPA: sigma 54-interacting transcriptional regulator [Thermodesulfobacteriota bacterium]|nr:sigma 54-interacting transcriptional regulator [Thermodesulfobacteriota bacterium]